MYSQYCIMNQSENSDLYNDTIPSIFEPTAIFQNDGRHRYFPVKTGQTASVRGVLCGEWYATRTAEISKNLASATAQALPRVPGGHKKHHHQRNFALRCLSPEYWQLFYQYPKENLQVSWTLQNFILFTRWIKKIENFYFFEFLGFHDSTHWSCMTTEWQTSLLFLTPDV